MKIADECRCQLCKRHVRTTWHHLIPRALHTKKKFINRFGKEEMRTRGADLCKLCHDGLHDLFTEKELGWTYNTIEALLANERVKKHVDWVKKQKAA